MVVTTLQNQPRASLNSTFDTSTYTVSITEPQNSDKHGADAASFSRRLYLTVLSIHVPPLDRFLIEAYPSYSTYRIHNRISLGLRIQSSSDCYQHLTPMWKSKAGKRNSDHSQVHFSASHTRPLQRLILQGQYWARPQDRSTTCQLQRYRLLSL